MSYIFQSGDGLYRVDDGHVTRIDDPPATLRIKLPEGWEVSRLAENVLDLKRQPDGSWGL